MSDYDEIIEIDHIEKEEKEIIEIDLDEEEETENQEENINMKNNNSILIAPLSTGNTQETVESKQPKKRKTTPNARDWILTINPKTLPHYKEIENYILSRAGINYMLTVEHLGQKRKHYHIYCQFTFSIKLAKKKLYGAHFKPKKSTPQACQEYLLCQDKKHRDKGVKAKIINEYGVLRKTGANPSIREMETMNDDEVKDIDPRLYRIANEVREAKKEKDGWHEVLNEIRTDKLQAPEIIYVTGEPGLGKTYGAMKDAVLREPDNNKIGRIQINNNFFKFTNPDAPTLIINEFRPSQLYASDFLELTDKYGFQANIKNGFKYIRPKRLYICSTISPFHLYKNDNEKNQQFLRRITTLYTAVNDDKKTHRLIDSTDLIKAKLNQIEESEF